MCIELRGLDRAHQFDLPRATGLVQAATERQNNMSQTLLRSVRLINEYNTDQNALLITPPSTRSAAPVVAEARGLAM